MSQLAHFHIETISRESITVQNGQPVLQGL